MRIVSKVTMAVAAALVGGSAMALTPGTAHDVNLTVAGSSAFKSTFKSELASICSDTVDQYTASGTGAPDMVAYSCTLASTAAVPAALQGKKSLVYYRSEGGSVYGVGPIAKGVQITRLKVDASCTGTSPSYSCATSGWSLAADSGSGQLEKATVQLGISDEEPAMFVGANWPALATESIFGAAPTPAQLGNITSKQSAVGQTFAVYVNKAVTGGTAGQHLNLSKQTLTSIFSGAYTNWSQVPGATSTDDIVVCKRESGSGTQIGADMYFNGTNCSSSAFGFVDSTVALNASGGAEKTCIGNSANPGAIGYVAIEATIPSNTSIVDIDGVVPSRNNAALGSYGYWFEVSFNSGAALAATTLEKSLASTMISRLRAQATVPSTSASVFALPVGANTPSFTNAADTSHPVSLATRGGNSCALPQAQN